MNTKDIDRYIAKKILSLPNSVEEGVEELQGKIGIILDKARRQNWKNGGVLEYDSLDLLAESDEIIRTTLTHHITQIRKEAVEEAIKIVEGEYIRYPDTNKVQEGEYNYALLNAVNSLQTLTNPNNPK